MNPSTAYLGIGSNLGNRERTIAHALEKLDNDPNVQVIAISQRITTQAQGGPANQPDFLNAAAQIATTLTPDQLLSVLQKIENNLGRIRDEHWGPRTIDLDLLLFGDHIIETPQLKVPHPLLHTRRFVLQPLAEIAPATLHPQLRQTIQQLLDQLEDA